MGFRGRVILHLAGIAASLMLLSWLVLNTQLYITVAVLSGVLAIQVLLLFRLINRTNVQLARFLRAVQHADFSQNFRGQLPDKGFHELGAAFDAILERFRHERSEKEELASYLQVFIQQVPVAVLCLDEEGAIPVSNNALRRLADLNGPITHLQQIRAFSPSLADLLVSISPGHDRSLRLTDAAAPLHLKVNCSVLRGRGRQQKLLSIQDIRSDLDASEVQAWQNLIRVMTHEIMNSIAPIASLADTTGHTLKDAREKFPDDPDLYSALLADASAGVEVIQSRSAGLLRFVQSYRSLARLPQPERDTLRIDALFRSVEALSRARAKTEAVSISFQTLPENLSLFADEALLEQALINLLNNALDAVSGRVNALIEVSAQVYQQNRIAISVRDNGAGIKPQNLASVFVPFFTTKRTGSGIGMSLVRQIALLHEGSVTLVSAPDEGTTVTLLLPAF